MNKSDNFHTISETTLNFKLIALLPLLVLYHFFITFSKTSNFYDLLAIIITIVIIFWILKYFRRTSKLFYNSKTKIIRIQDKKIINEIHINEISDYVSLFSHVNKSMNFYTMFYIKFKNTSKRNIKFILHEDNKKNVQVFNQFRQDFIKNKQGYS